MALYLVVANQTIGGEQLTAKLDELAAAVAKGRAEFVKQFEARRRGRSGCRTRREPSRCSDHDHESF